jgi:D-3-phosphoglycerate dehydrogenase / 2-oxoglutarate reductase
MAPILLFDFDSTLIQDEGLDALFERSLSEAPDRDDRVRAFQEITDLGMSGELGFAESLERRLALLRTHRNVVLEVARELVERLTPSVERHRSFFQNWRDGEGVHVLSGGFRELIEPTAERLGIPAHRIHAHRFRYGTEGEVLGADPETALARGGKLEAVRELGLDPSDVWMVGDGATDLEVRLAGLASTFVAFVENRARPSVVSQADRVVHSMEELLELLAERP